MKKQTSSKKSSGLSKSERLKVIKEIMQTLLETKKIENEHKINPEELFRPFTK